MGNPHANAGREEGEGSEYGKPHVNDGLYGQPPCKHKREKCPCFCGVAAIQLRGACNVYGGEVRVRKMQWPARLEGPARIAAVCGKVSYSLGSARCAF